MKIFTFYRRDGMVRASLLSVFCFLFFGTLIRANETGSYFASTTITGVTPGGTLRLGIPFTVQGTYTGPADSVQISLSLDAGLPFDYSLNATSGYRGVTITGAGTWEFTYTPTHPGTILLRSRAREGGTWGPVSTYSVTVAENPSPEFAPGGPILVVYDPSDYFGQYTAEMLRNEGLKSFAMAPIGSMNVGDYELTKYDVVILATISGLTQPQADALNSFVVNNGGSLIAYRPDPLLNGLMGITGRADNARSNQYLQVVTTTGTPGAGIVDETMQFHDVADNYTIGVGVTAIAYFHTGAGGTHENPAITQRVYESGGRAIAFAYDLNRSIVFTRQGNLDWKYQARSPAPPGWPVNWPIRANDMFYGNMAGDPQPDWVDLNKIQIPQADEQQRLLANLILLANYHRKPLPKFWYFPRRVKGVFVMTGDDHSRQAYLPNDPSYVESLTGAYFNLFKQRTPAGFDNPEGVADWRAIRGTSYLYDDSYHVNDSVVYYSNQGFELSTHFQSDHLNLPDQIIPFWMNTQLSDLRTHNPSIEPYSTERTHAIVWTGWAHFPRISKERYGIRLDVNYYHFPPSWIGKDAPGGERNGFMTGSAMPMRFADSNGAFINSYQVLTHITDESGQTFPKAANDVMAGINRGFYGAYCINWHTDNHDMSGANAMIDVALANNIPIVSSRQLLNWLDAKETTSFNSLAWSGNVLTFNITGGVRNLNLMLPDKLEGNLQLIEVRRNGAPVAITRDVIAGIEYGFVDAEPGSYAAVYGLPDCDPMDPVLSTDKTLLCPGEEAHLTITTSSNDGPFTVVINGITYTNVSSGIPFTSIQASSGVQEHIFNGTPAPPVDGDANEVELGVRFTVDGAGVIEGIRFMPGGAVVPAGRTVTLWDGPGHIIGSGTSQNETMSGWQNVLFASPVAVGSGQTYTASMHVPDGIRYSYGSGGDGFGSPRTNGSISVPANGGVFRYGPIALPTQVFNGTNYWVDVIYRKSIPGGATTYPLTSITNNEGCTELVSDQSVTITIDPNCTVTPVKFSSFTGEAQYNNAVLHWTTAMEANSAYFEVQRSADGQMFVPVGRVQAAGNSSLPLQYNFTDPGLGQQRYFYRLKQVDIDGKFIYSSTISVVIGTGHEFLLMQNNPNPVSGSSVITYVVPVNTQLRLALYDNTGRMLKVLAQGAHQPGTYRVTVSKGQLSAGIYYYRLDASQTSLIKKMMIR